MTLIHNPKAGRADHPGRELRRAFREAGHEVAYASSKKKGWKQTLAQAGDLVVAAGGDGTVAKVARQLVGRGIPLTILPLGTANNLARTLGFSRPVEELIASLPAAQPRRVDVGVAFGPWGHRIVFEGIGGGLLADYIHGAGKAKGLSKRDEMMKHAAALRDSAKAYHGHDWRVIVDRKETSDRYLFFEALNIPSVGPALHLTPDARVDDGRFDLVLVAERDREVMTRYLTARLENGREAAFPLPARRFRQLEISCEKTPLHLDGKLPRRSTSERFMLKLKVEPRALLLLSNG